MGCFDSVYVACTKCDKNIEFQSKAGRCGLNDFTVFDVPPIIAGALNGESRHCVCGAVLTLEVQTLIRVLCR